MLSDYVMALLKHDASDDELQSMLQEQLEDFLAEQTAGFVGKTLGALRSQAYLPEASRTEAVHASGSTPGAGSSRKRAADDEGRRSPAKSHRDLESQDGGRRSLRESEARERRDTASGDEQRGARRGDGQRQKPLCRDFHQRGYCSRGDSCKFDHSFPTPKADGFTGVQPMMGMQMPPMNPQFAAIPPRGPQHPFMGVGPQFGAHGNGAGWNGQHLGAATMGEGMHQGYMDGLNGAAGSGEGGDLAGRLGGPGPPRGDFGQRGARGGGRGGRGGGARGMFEKRPTSNTTLVIENVPQEHLELVKVNEYFKKFGTITNIQIDVDNKKALVSYAQPAEAKAAHSSPEVIFNNRFVKVYFQKLDDPFVKPKETPPSASVVHPPPKSNFVPGQTSNKFVRPNLVQEKAKEAQETAQKRLDQLMAEQKEIMAKLTNGDASAEEKKLMMARFGPLESEIKQATEDVRAAVSGATAKESSPSVAPSKWKEQKDEKEREQLDRELEALKTGSSSGSTTEELKAHLARLQAEAAQLGIDASETAGGAGRGGFRGRARGGFRGSSRGFNSFSRGRGGMVVNRASMSLDNRPSKLHITDVPQGTDNAKVKEHLKQFGDVHNIEDKDDGSFVVHYKARASGERALRTGLAVPDVGTIKAAWSNEGHAAPSGAAETSEGAVAVHGDAGEGFAEGEDDEGDREEHFRR